MTALDRSSSIERELRVAIHMDGTPGTVDDGLSRKYVAIVVLCAAGAACADAWG